MCSYGEVFKAVWRGTEVAVKKLPVALLENKDFLRDFKQEALIMSSLRHPNVLMVCVASPLSVTEVKFMGSCMIEEDICIIMEFMSRGSVHRLLHDESFEMKSSLVIRVCIKSRSNCLIHCTVCFRYSSRHAVSTLLYSHCAAS